MLINSTSWQEDTEGRSQSFSKSLEKLLCNRLSRRWSRLKRHIDRLLWLNIHKVSGYNVSNSCGELDFADLISRPKDKKSSTTEKEAEVKCEKAVMCPKLVLLLYFSRGVIIREATSLIKKGSLHNWELRPFKYHPEGEAHSSHFHLAFTFSSFQFLSELFGRRQQALIKLDPHLLSICSFPVLILEVCWGWSYTVSPLVEHLHPSIDSSIVHPVLMTATKLCKYKAVNRGTFRGSCNH